MKVFTTYFESPLGLIQLKAAENALLSVLFNNKFNIPENVHSAETADSVILMLAKKQLADYFQGVLTSFDLPLLMIGTDFQRAVWNELLNIPYGQTRTYSGMAKTMGNKNLTRALAGANAKNILNIIVPCHRVMGANGSLTGYGGEIWRKRWLVDFENPSSQLVFS